MSDYTDVICGIGLPKDESPAPKGKIDLTIGVFFDGTCNNKFNIDATKDGVVIPTDKDKNKSYFGTL